MNTTRHHLAKPMAALVVGVLGLIGALESSTATVSAHSDNGPPGLAAGTAFRWIDPCPAVDDEPICDLVSSVEQSGSGGTKVTRLPASTETQKADQITDWIDSIPSCRRVPGPEVVYCPY